MEREDRERIKNHIVKYFHGGDGEGAKKRLAPLFFEGYKRVEK